jgi:hypothetical protein
MKVQVFFAFLSSQINLVMRNLLLVSLFIISRISLFADEGMWLPLLLKQLNEKEMKKMGMKISAEDIYSVNKSSMKDAVVLFGRGCTGEIISSSSLLLTNHHCGFGQIQDHSSLEHDYLKDGFWAKNHSEELPNPGLTATFIISMEDVTSKILDGMSNSLSEKEREELINTNSKKIIAEAIANTHYEGIIKSMYNGNEYVLFITEVFRDIRLVGAPPQSIGNFGKDTDNWMWPRHTADFSMFRIYAGKDNKPADYSTENVPFIPRHHFPISTSGIKENDFTMVYGFPARTNEYLSSSAVEQIVEQNNPLKVNLRGKRLDIMNQYMNADRGVFIKYADKYSGVSNYHKKWAGEAKGLKTANAIAKKVEFEDIFQQRVASNSSFSEYSTLMSDLKSEYTKLAVIQPELDLFQEAILTSEILKFSYSMRNLSVFPAKSTESKKQFNENIEKSKERILAHFKDYHAALDKDLTTAMLFEYYHLSTRNYSPEPLSALNKQASKIDIANYVDNLFLNSIFSNQSRLESVLKQSDSMLVASIQNDPAFKLANFYYNAFYSEIAKEYNSINERLIPLNRKYMAALRVVVPEKKYYPDANQTLRIAYGKAEGYKPSDAIEYNWYTTVDGILEKNNSGNPDYEIPNRLRTLIETRDFGPYADKDGKLRTCFSASNHTTGGNSGSPVFNGKGQLIGTNFDRNWEGTMSDVYYDINQVRNITLDIRYTLFIVDKFAGASHLIKEMTLVK